MVTRRNTALGRWGRWVLQNLIYITGTFECVLNAVGLEAEQDPEPRQPRPGSSSGAGSWAFPCFDVDLDSLGQVERCQRECYAQTLSTSVGVA